MVPESCFQPDCELRFPVSKEVLTGGSWSLVCKMIGMMEPKSYVSVIDKSVPAI